MGIKKFKPITPGLRQKMVSDFAEITTDRPLKALVKGKKNDGGRSGAGRIAVRRRGGGHKQRYRIIDFKRNKDGIPGKVATIEYDPNRSARIALIHYADGEKRYIIAPNGLSVGDTIESGQGIKARTGNSMTLADIPIGTEIHNIELHPGHGAQLVRSAGNSAQLLAREGKYATVRLPSKEMRLIHIACRATVGQVGNIDKENISLGKAGRARWLNKRPKVRGVVMNPVDHPMGGGEGKTSGGRHPCTPQGIPTKGYKTRRKRRNSNKFIVRGRKK